VPIYDYKCPECGRKEIDVFVHHHDDVVKCKQCHEKMSRLFPNSSKYIGAACFPSEGIFLENVSPNGHRFHSKKEMKAFEKKTGVTIGMLH